MLNKRTRKILMASCIAIAPAYAFAQTQQPSTPPASQQTQTAPSAQTQTAPSAQTQTTPSTQTQTTTTQTTQQRQSASSMKVLSAPETGQMMGTDLRGTNVYGANNESVGDIQDLLIDRQGKIVAMIVGVGGFLGIGQKNVAIPFDAFEIVDQASASASRTGTGAGTTTTTTTTDRGTTASGSAAQTDRDRMSTGAVPGDTSVDRQRTTAQQAEDSARAQNQQSTATRSDTQTRTAQTGVMRPERIVLRGMTKADLEAAPEFRKDGSRADTSSGSRATGTGTGTGTGSSNR